MASCSLRVCGQKVKIKVAMSFIAIFTVVETLTISSGSENSNAVVL